MSKKRGRITNPEPFLPLGSDAFSSSKKRSKPPKHHQVHQKLVPCAVSSKILKQAHLQQKEIQHEEEDNENDDVNKFVLPQLHGLKDNDDEDDVDDFAGFSENPTQFGQPDFEVEIDEEDEKLLEDYLSKSTWANKLFDKIIEKDAQVSSGAAQQMSNLNPKWIELYKDVGSCLSKYTSGKIPKALKHIPSSECWEELLYLTEPEKWSPNAMYQATRIFASNMSDRKVEKFYKLYLLPRVRRDLHNNKTLHFALYRSVMKAVYKPAAFNKGILFPLWESKTCTRVETSKFLSIIAKISIPVLHASVALLKLADMEHFNKKSYFIISLIEKNYALPYRVVDALVAHFMRFYEYSSKLPVIWHQSLHAFAQRYKNSLTKEDKANLKNLVERQTHKLITPGILIELNNSLNRGEEQDDLMSISRAHFVAKEDMSDMPDVPLEDDY
ncbi:hypothetical protein ABFX02_10G059900 [Erythranthe guttata]